MPVSASCSSCSWSISSRSSGYSPLQAGVATLPVTALMLALSARAGLLADRIGPRLPMTIGPLGIAAGLALLSRVQADSTYVGTVLPGLLVFGLGLSLTVAPLTATVLAAAADDDTRGLRPASTMRSRAVQVSSPWR